MPMDSLLFVFTLDRYKGYLLCAALLWFFLMHFLSQFITEVTWKLVILHGK